MNLDTSVIRLDAAAARRHIDAGDMLVIDVRSADEYAEGALPGAMNVPWPRLRPIRAVEFDTPILLYCDTGARSRKAAEVLLALGFQRVHTMGRMDKYFKT
ncbi:MAG: rhodanese-like domain-containing protein [Gammaproteobacteria bacterium]|nr:rhodanese-like domain-containing protein [Gammaproteobacteria bacterium]